MFTNSVSASTQKKRFHIKNNTRRNIIGWLFCAPAVICFVVFIVYPIISAIILSFTTADGVSTPTFVGIAQYKLIFNKDEAFKKSFIMILQYSAIAIPLNVGIAFIFALLINSIRKGSKFFRAMYYLPCLTSAIAAGSVFRQLFDYKGLINSFLSFFNAKGPIWLEGHWTGLIAIIVLSVWMGAGANMIIFFSALKGLDPTLNEAARIDGAGRFRILWKITIPSLKPTIFFVLTMAIIGSMQLYEPILMMTGGGFNTASPVYRIFNAFGSSSRLGYACTQSVILFVFIILVSQVFNRLGKENV